LLIVIPGLFCVCQRDLAEVKISPQIAGIAADTCCMVYIFLFAEIEYLSRNALSGRCLLFTFFVLDTKKDNKKKSRQQQIQPPEKSGLAVAAV
jgi:hypothetical protein